jgi:hypothetical protein
MYHVPSLVVSLVSFQKGFSPLLFPSSSVSTPFSPSNHQIILQVVVKMLNNAVIAFLQLWLATLAFAAPIADKVTVTGAQPWHYGTGGGIIGFIILVLDILVWSAYPQVSPLSRPC